jgi:hypothetical protein
MLKSNTELELTDSLIFGKNNITFPVSPKLGEVVLKDFVMYIYCTLDGITTWYPLTNKKNSYVHIQSTLATEWTVVHNLNTIDILYQVSSVTGELIFANITPVDSNSFKVELTEATDGRVVVFGDAEKYAASVTADSITVNTLHADNIYSISQIDNKVTAIESTLNAILGI